MGHSTDVIRVRRMCLACCVPKATNTRPEFEIIIAFKICYTTAPKCYVIRTLTMLMLGRFRGRFRQNILNWILWRHSQHALHCECELTFSSGAEYLKRSVQFQACTGRFCEVECYSLGNKNKILNSYLQHLIRSGQIKSDDEIYHATFCGAIQPNNAVSCCYHSIRTDDGATAPLRSVL
jgi:hypothetical protein